MLPQYVHWTMQNSTWAGTLALLAVLALKSSLSLPLCRRQVADRVKEGYPDQLREYMVVIV